MEKYTGVDYGTIDSKQYVKDFIKSYDELQKENMMSNYEMDSLEDVEFNFEIPEEMDSDLSELQSYVYQRVSAMENYYSEFFVENSLKRLFIKIYTLRSQPGLSDFDKRVIDDLLDYIYDYNSAYEECFNAWKIELDAMNQVSSNLSKGNSR